MPTGLARYGLRPNAYHHTPMLDPLHCATDADLIAFAGGLEHLEPLETRLFVSGEKGQVSVVLVCGGAGAGRSSVCNLLLSKYRDGTGIDVERFLMPEREFPSAGHDTRQIVKTWMLSLYEKIDDASIEIDDELTSKLEDPSKALAGEGDGWVPQARAIVRQASKLLWGLDDRAAFGVCIENVMSQAVVSDLRKVFGASKTCVCITVRDDADEREGITGGFTVVDNEGWEPRDSEDIPVVRLRPLNGQAAADVILKRWNSYRPGIETPFKDDDLAAAFDDRGRPAAGVLSTVRAVLTWRGGFGGSDEWPTDSSLAFSRTDLCNGIANAETLK